MHPQLFRIKATLVRVELVQMMIVEESGFELVSFHSLMCATVSVLMMLLIKILAAT
jgi:hypothetical protein